MPPHCPSALQRRVWNIQQFKLEKVLYVGSISRVLRAVDLSSGMTVALKVYKRHKLSDMEKCAASRPFGLFCLTLFWLAVPGALHYSSGHSLATYLHSLLAYYRRLMYSLASFGHT